MRKKDSEIYIGQKIKTNKKFKPLLANGNVFDTRGEEFCGVIIAKRGKYYIVDFGKEYEFTHYSDGLLQNPTGYALSSTEFSVEEEVAIEDKNERDFCFMFREAAFMNLERIPGEIRSLEDKTRSLSSSIKSMAMEIEDKEKDLLKKNIELKAKKEYASTMSVDLADAQKQYHKLFLNPKVKEVEVIGRKIIITTNDLGYKNENTGIYFVSGAYKILLDMDDPTEFRVVNYKKHYAKHIFNPCVKEGSVCMGSSVGTTVNALLSKRAFIPFVHTIIDFLEEPNYGRPYLNERDFLAGNIVTMSPSDQLDWFNMSYWGENEEWDEEEYKRLKHLPENICIKCGKKHYLDVCPHCLYS